MGLDFFSPFFEIALVNDPYFLLPEPHAIPSQTDCSRKQTDVAQVVQAGYLDQSHVPKDIGQYQMSGETSISFVTAFFEPESTIEVSR
jgi:hypothetical protein